MSTTITIELIAEVCISCGVVFGLSEQHKGQLKRTGATFYCPNGHGMVYGNTLEEQVKKLKKQLAEEQETAEYWRRSTIAEEKDHNSTKRRLSATKGVLTKTKKRVANGVCPCCSRTFKQLARHIRDKHPDYKSEEG